jgi:hypothetical protein
MKRRWPAAVTLTVPTVAVDVVEVAAGTATLAIVEGRGGGNKGGPLTTVGGAVSTVAIGTAIGAVVAPAALPPGDLYTRCHARPIAIVDAMNAVLAVSTRDQGRWRVGEAGTRGSPRTTAPGVALATGGGLLTFAAA